MQKTFALVIALVLTTVCARSAWAAPLKVACTGTSAMQGLGSTDGHHVPDELGRALGAGFEVRNFGAQGTTVIQSIGASYAATSQMRAALAYNPDIVLFWFGGNDSFRENWDAHKSEFHADYLRLVRAFQELPSHPKTFLVRLWVFVDAPVQRTVIDKEILPIIDQVAVETGSIPIDYRKAFEMHREYFPDGMHPNDTGTLAIGRLFADVVNGALSNAMQDAGADGSSLDARPTGDGAAGDVVVVGADGATGDAGPSSMTAGSGGATSVAGAGGAVVGSGGSISGSTGATGGSGGASPGTSGGNATGSGGLAGDGAGGRAATGPGAAPGVDAANGCGCRIISRTPAPRTSALLVALAALFWSRRRRRVRFQRR